MTDELNKGTNSNAVAEPQSETDVEAEQKKLLRYPRSIGFIISNEFCERFCYYGMRTILVLYLTRKLGYDDDVATIVYHVFTMLVYFMCTFGAILSDSWLGKFQTILYLSIVYVIGNIVISLGAVPPLNIPGEPMTILGLFLIALGSGGIKPCVAAFGGDQFVLPEQAKYMATFFSLFYFSINAGSLISTSITPILRQDVKCFGDDDCYSLAFGVPGVLMVVSILIFFFGKSLYRMTPPAGNMVVLVANCIGNAIATRWRESKFNKREHWLDYADVKYGKQLVNETKILLNILVLYIPLPFFWALFDQQGSRWTFQATRMNGDIGFTTIKPDQMQVVNPLLILVFIPLYDVLFYPLLDKIGIRRPLQKLTAGGILAGVAFLCSAIVELQLEATYPILPQAGLSQVRVFNTLPCDYMVNTNFEVNPAFQIKSLDAYQAYIPIEGSKQYRFQFTPAPGVVDTMCPEYETTVTLNEAKAQSFFFRNGALVEYEDSPAKSSSGLPLLRMITNFAGDHNVKFVDTLTDVNSVRFDGSSNNRTMHELPPTTVLIQVDNKNVTEIDISLGQVVTLVLIEHNGVIKSSVVEITSANTLSMMWLLPQFIIMTLGEVMFSVTGLSFSYSQAPVSMKSVLQACWMLTVAFGNVIDVIIVGLKIFDSQANEFFLFAGLMFVDMLLFMYLAYNYKSLVDADLSDDAPIEPASADEKKELSGVDNVAFTKDVPSGKND